MFIGRDEELKSLNERYSNSHYECAVIWGRRRVGKTELIIIERFSGLSIVHILLVFML